MSDFDFDPEPAQFTGDSLLERISRAYEKAIDTAGDAYDAEAFAENAYLAAHMTAWAHAVEDKVAITSRAKWCDNQPDVCEAKQDWNRAVAGRKRAHAKAEELQHRQMAAMAHQRFIREAT